MPIIKTKEELLASKIKARNYSSFLSSVYFLTKRSFSDYVPASPDTAIWSFGQIGLGSILTSGTLSSGTTYQVVSKTSSSDFTVSGAASNEKGTVFVANSTTPTWGGGSLASVNVSTSRLFSSITATAARGGTITLGGTATYYRSSGATNIVCPAIKVAAFIDLKAEDSSYFGTAVEATSGEIDSSGVFSFNIPADITEKLSIGNHTVCIDAYSPDNAAARLIVSGTTDNKRSFAIT